MGRIHKKVLKIPKKRLSFLSAFHFFCKKRAISVEIINKFSSSSGVILRLIPGGIAQMQMSIDICTTQFIKFYSFYKMSRKYLIMAVNKVVLTREKILTNSLLSKRVRFVNFSDWAENAYSKDQYVNFMDWAPTEDADAMKTNSSWVRKSYKNTWSGIRKSVKRFSRHSRMRKFKEIRMAEKEFMDWD